ncbi:hypothetical protein AWW66_01085 [Micromonospora rosaria]|uniref:Methionyl-tRNA synthetase n=1 Tax=Micromonospora rosaria TaxID=47874 RepID=A0A136PZC1_9ACTN|nr:class I tRNA ligase family protein [Micromonospora rosaria]KXK63805.1 hypothetical protein AWW66_01085 [Micromonospora rosaria]
MTASADAPLTVLLSPPPTPNGPLHVGHLAGPYVAADVAARAARARGERVLTVCGTDDHQNYVVTRADRDGRGPDAVVADHGARIREVFARARVEHDVHTSPSTDPAYRRAVGDLFALVDRAVLTAGPPALACRDCHRTLHHAYVAGRCPGCRAAMGGGTCEECGEFATARDLVAAACARCGGPPVETDRPTRVLRLEEHRAGLTEVWSRAALPDRVRGLLAALLRRGLPDVPASYPTDWGLPGGTGRIDVWFEMGLAYLSVVARSVDPDARTLDDHVRAWRRLGGLWAFLGVDNAFYYAALFPALLLATGVPAERCLSGLVVNEFYRLDGEKFSTSRDHAVWAHDLLRTADPETVRLYLSLDRPAPHPTNFTTAAFQRFARRPWSAGPPLTPGEVDRAGQALRLAHFDPATAVRCLLPAAGAGDPAAVRLLDLVRGRATEARG